MPAPLPVLLVAHQLPPLGGPGVRRPASWVRAWPRHGVVPHVVSAPAEDGARFHGYPILHGSDDGLEGTEVVRVPTPPPSGVAGALVRSLPPRIAWTLCHRRLREPESPWGAAALPVAVDLARRTGARVVVSTSQPYEAHAVGCEVARRLGLPWVADFRDPMTEAEGRWWPSRLHWWAERRQERAWFAAARLVWATAAAAADRWRVRFPWAAGKVRLHRNAVEDPAALAALPAAPPPPPLRIGHVGRFPDHGARSRARRFDFRPGRRAGTGASPAAFFAGAERFLARRPEARGRLVWVTVGDPGEGRRPAGLVDEAHGPRANAEALRIAAGCHALHLPLTVPPPWGSLFVNQKVYEYAALGRPVLVAGTPREATDLLGDLAHVAPSDDPDATAALLEGLWTGTIPTAPSPHEAASQEDVAARCADELRSLVT